MPTTASNSMRDYVFSLSKEELYQLKDLVENRIDEIVYGASSFEALAEKFDKKPQCPRCHSDNYILHGNTPQGKQRYKCLNCNKTYTLTSETIFNSSKLSFHKLSRYAELMSFNVPLECIEEICEISHPTALLWRRKFHETVNDYQDKIILKDRVWIDETYLMDTNVIRDDGYKKRGLSNQQICIVVAIDVHKNALALVCGHGKPTASKIYKSLKDHIAEGSILIHDGDKSHNKLVEELNLYSKTYKANTKDSTYLKEMALINNLCSWIKRYIYRFIGMRKDYLQPYLNWFAYMFRVNGEIDKWPKTEQILRHLILKNALFTRK